MKTTITFIKFYPSRYWFFRFFKFKHIVGFKIRLFGKEIFISENNPTEKLIQIGNENCYN
jgi:hypothetical protein